MQKVRNIEHGGGKLAVIVDEKDNEDVKYIIMVDDGTGNGIGIPSLMINKTPGNALLDFYSQATPTERQKIKLFTNFQIYDHEDIVKYDLIMSSYSDKGLDFISEFKAYHDKLGSKALMTPRYLSFACFDCADDIKAKDCFGNGKYCAYDYRNFNMNGRTILEGNLRQKCIYLNSIATKGNDEDYWVYMKRAHSLCYDDFTEDCSKAVHTKIGLDFSKTEKCFNESFIRRGQADEDNTILAEDFDYLLYGGFDIVPSVIINHFRYQGDMAPTYVFEAICAGFNKKPEECNSSAKEIEEEAALNSTSTIQRVGRKHVTFNWLLLVIVILVILNIALVIF